MIKTYELKCLPEYFHAVIDGRKTFELRKDDRDYRVGQFILFREWNGKKYTGHEVRCRITYILRDCPEYGLAEDFCILGFVLPEFTRE